MKTSAGDHARDAWDGVLAKRRPHHVIHLIARKRDRDRWLAG
jgi:hypothetical protein